jgi:hypothetical protein
MAEKEGMQYSLLARISNPNYKPGQELFAKKEQSRVEQQHEEERKSMAAKQVRLWDLD